MYFLCVFLYFTITAKVMDTAAVKPSETETALKSPTKSQTHSDSSSLALSTQGHDVSPARSLTLSTSMDQDYPDEGYILLDECFSGTSSAMSTSSGTPSPGNTLSSRNAVPLAAEYQNLDSTSDGKSVSDPPPPYELAVSLSNFVHASRSTNGVFEGIPVPKGNGSTGIGMSDSHSMAGATNMEFVAHSKHGNIELPPALPAKMSSAVPDVEYDVPISGLVHGHALYSAPSPQHGSTAAPPQPHMAHGRMHRYVNTAPAVVRTQSPTSSATQKNYAESSAASRQQFGSPTTRTAQHDAVAPPSYSLLPPRSHG